MLSSQDVGGEAAWTPTTAEELCRWWRSVGCELLFRLDGFGTPLLSTRDVRFVAFNVCMVDTIYRFQFKFRGQLLPVLFPG